MNNWRGEYTRRKKLYSKLKTEVIRILRQELKRKEIIIHDIPRRVKKFNSLRDKAIRLQTEDPFKDIHDICGVRVVCLFRNDLKRIGDIIESSFRIHAKDDKINSQPDAFGYMSVDYIGSLPASFAGPRYDELKDLEFEIQLRTMAMDAWATVSHHIDYKSEPAIPLHLKKDFNALSALFFVADSEFQRFYELREQAKREAAQKGSGQIEKEEINLDTLRAYLTNKYRDRQLGSATDLSELIEEMRRAEYETIGRLDEALQKSAGAFQEYEKDYPHLGQEGALRPCYGVIRRSLLILDEKYRRVRNTPEDMENIYKGYAHLLDS